MQQIDLLQGQTVVNPQRAVAKRMEKRLERQDRRGGEK
jgi:hypothetical protein